jgi:two-component system phosphate regulon sensor histidine kinase PhoR
MTLWTVTIAGGLGLAVGRWWAYRLHARDLQRLRSALREAEAASGHAALEAEQTRLQLEALARIQDEPCLHFDAGGWLVWASPAAIKAFGLRPNERPSLLALTGSAVLEQQMAELPPETGEQSQVLIRDRRYELRAWRMQGGALMIALRDVSEREQLARARRDLVANISHDLRTPLTSIGLLVERLDDPDLAPHDHVATLARVREQLARLLELATGLVEIGRLESGRSPLRLSRHSLRSLVEAALAGLEPQISKHRLRIEMDLDAPLFVLADAAEVRRVLVNLIENGIRAMSYPDAATPPGFELETGPAKVPNITVLARLSGDGDWIEIAVRDEGVGIPPRDLERIFERFFRTDRSRSQPGTGIGLAIAKHIVEGHGGRVWAENNPVRGATIWFTLPAEPTDVAATEV